MAHFPRDWKIRTRRYRFTGVTIFTVYRHDAAYVGANHDGYRAVGSRHTLDDALRFIREAMGEVPA